MGSSSSVPNEALQRRQRALLGGLLLTVYLLYTSCFLGVLGSNDGSHFALVKALAERGSYRIAREDRVYALEDVATDSRSSDKTGAVIYSNKPPGTALLALPYYWLAKLSDPLSRRSHPPNMRNKQTRRGVEEMTYTLAREKYGYQESYVNFRAMHRSDWPRQNAVNLASASGGVACCALVYGLARQLGVSFGPAVLTMLLAAFGTLQWRYATALFAHVFSAAILMAQVYWLATRDAWGSVSKSLAWGLLVGIAMLVEYQAIVTVPLVVGYWLWQAGRCLPVRVLFSRLAATALGAVLPLAYLAFFQWTCFGSPWQTTVTRSVNFEYASSSQSMLSGSVGEGLWSLLAGNPNARDKEYRGHGLLTTSPFLVLALGGWAFCTQGSRRLALLAAVLLTVHTAVIAHVRAPLGGDTYDARYLLRIVPLAAVGFGVLLERARRLRQFPMRWILYGILAVPCVVSVVRAVEMVSTFQTHVMFMPARAREADLLFLGKAWLFALGDRAQFFEATADLWRGTGYLLGASFTNVTNWPLLLASLVIAAGAVGLVWSARCLRDRLRGGTSASRPRG